MAKAVKLITTVLPGHRVEVSTPELAVGQRVEVFVVEEEAAEEQPRLHLADLMAGPLTREPLFRTAEEVDRYLQGERDSWER